MILIPFDPTVSADQILRIQLDTQLVELRLVWNTRSERWALSVSGAFGELLNLHVVPDWPLLRGREASTSFEGDFLVRRLTAAAPERIGYGDLGTVWGLCWLTPAEKDTWAVFDGLG